MTDEFFDDEQELIEAAAAGPSEDAAPASPVEEGAEDAPADAADAEPARRDAPPFWMVLAIAAIALVLGVVIGYLMGTSATISELEAAQREASQQAQAMGGGAELPDGHPQLSVDEDGTARIAGSSAE